jgi:hypothetical protein
MMFLMENSNELGAGAVCAAIGASAETSRERATRRRMVRRF